MQFEDCLTRNYNIDMRELVKEKENELIKNPEL